MLLEEIDLNNNRQSLNHFFLLFSLLVLVTVRGEGLKNLLKVLDLLRLNGTLFYHDRNKQITGSYSENGIRL